MHLSNFDWRYIPHSHVVSDWMNVSIVSYLCILILFSAAVFHL